MIGKQTTLKRPQTFLKKRLASINSDIVLAKAIINIELVKNIYKTKMKKYKKKLLD